MQVTPVFFSRKYNQGTSIYNWGSSYKYSNW